MEESIARTVAPLSPERAQNLTKLVDNAISKIHCAFDDFSIKGCCFSFNGGKDSTVLFHLIRLALERYGDSPHAFNEIMTVYFCQENEFPEVSSFMKTECERYDIALQRFDMGMKEGMKHLVEEHGIKAVFLGVRQHDPHGGSVLTRSPSTKGWPPFSRVHPILNWDYDDVWDFLLQYDFPYCSLYDEGYTSLGGTHNTERNASLRVGVTSTYRPAYELRDHTEERQGRGQS